MSTPFKLVFLLLTGLLLGFMGPPAQAWPEAARAQSGTVALTAAAWSLGLLLAMGIAGAARRRAAEVEARNAELAAANHALQEEIAFRVRVEGERTAQQRETEEGAQVLTHTNALLAQASGRFQELFQGLPVACVCGDRTGRVMEWNRAWTRMHGLDSPLGRPLGELIEDMEGASALSEAITAALAGEAHEGIEWTYRRNDGARIHVLSSVFPLRGSDGGITGVLCADVDISAQQKAEDALRESEERLHALYNMTSQQGLSFEEKTEAMLEMGCVQFGLEIGVLARVRDDQYEVIQARSPGEVIPRGLTLPLGNTYCLEALARADTLSFEQAGRTERRDTPAYRRLGLESYIGTPIRVDGAVWGMLCFAGAQPHAALFTSGDREMVRLMAQWIGGEIARRQAADAIHASEERFRTAIASMSEGLVLMDTDGIIRICNESAEHILGVTRSEIEAWRPLNPEYVARREDGTPFPQGSYPLVVSLRSGQPQRDVIAGLPRLGGGMLWVSINSTPLFHPGEDTPYAAVATFTDITERRRQEDLIAEQMVQIQEHTKVLEIQKRELELANAELETLALRDGLTGLSNRRAFGQRLALEMHRAIRYGTPLSLLLLDVDSFKEYNDTFGHVAGDQVLRTLAEVLRAQGRETDFFARYGGEEFVVILPHTGSDGARTMAERLRAAVGVAVWHGRLVTASIGAATLLPGMATEDDLVSAADRALYAAKAAGRDRVIHALSLGGAAASLPSPSPA